jgi:hypothetical protein
MISNESTTPSGVLLVLDLLHHFFVARCAMQATLVKHRILELGEDGEKSQGHSPATPTAASGYARPGEAFGGIGPHCAGIPQQGRQGSAPHN